MSGEFGSYSSGYFPYQIEVAVDDCKRGGDELTRLWGEFLEAFAPVAKSIAYSEAGDSGPDDSIMENILQKKALATALRNIENYLDPYERVMQEAVRQHEQGQKK